MPMDVITNVVEAAHVSQLAVDHGETGKFEVRVFDESTKNCIQLPAELDKHVVVQHDYQAQEFVVQGAPQDNQAKRVQVFVGLIKCLKKALGILKKHVMAQAKNVNPRRRGMYTFLYGGRVNVDTFYDYKD